MDERPYLVKLVRDDIAAHLGSGEVTYAPVDDPELHRCLLRDKLVEEALEYAKDPTLGELADVCQALIDCLKVDLGLSVEDLMTERRRKLDSRGGFEHGTAMFIRTKSPDDEEHQHHA